MNNPQELWWTAALWPKGRKEQVVILAETDEDARKLGELLTQDRVFEEREEPREYEPPLPEDAALLLYVSDRVNQLPGFLEARDLPVVLILPEISGKTLAFLTRPEGSQAKKASQSQPLHIVGIFKQKNLLSEERFDLEDAGNLLRVIKHTLRRVLPEPLSQEGTQDFLVKPIQWKISVEKEEKVEPLLTLFLDEPMREFLQRLQTALQNMKEAYRHLIGSEIQDAIRSKGEDCFKTLVSPSKTAKSKCEILQEHFRLDGDPPRFQPAHIFIEGETGTGKSFLRHLIASFLGVGSHMAYINATTLSKELLEVELFGSVRGAFTDAETRPGALFLRSGGLIFLDEIGDVDPAIQPKLLQYLEDFRFSPVGRQDLTLFSPTYFVAATNRDVRQMIREGKFREDLYFRFRTHLHMPALRERKSDMKVLISFLLQSPHINPHRAVTHITYRAILTLLEADFRQGNFRELERILNLAVSRARAEGTRTLQAKHIHWAFYHTC